MLHTAPVRAGLLAVAAALLTATAPASALVPVPNGDFTLGSAGWAVSGLSEVADGVAKMGQDGCFGAEEEGDVARIAALAPVTFPPILTGKLQFDYKVRTADSATFSGLRVTLFPTLANQGQAQVIDTFNPNPSWGTCRTFEGTRTIIVPPSMVNYAARITFDVFEDGYGDRFYIELDNIEVSL